MRKYFLLILLIEFITTKNIYCQINVGDTLQFWSVAYIDWLPSPPIPQRIINAVCESIGDECYLFVDTEISNPPSVQQINSLVNIFDTLFVSNLAQLYGSVPDEFDNDPKIYILIIPNEGWVGYFDPAHQMADSTVWQLWGKHSNQKEIVYMSHDVFNYGADMVLAHEFGHMLHWGRDHSPEPPNDPVKYWEDAWIDEGFATFSPVYLLEDLNQQSVYDNQAYFASQSDLSLIHFESGLCYNQVKLWMTFMYEHYGAVDFIETLISDQANGIEGVVNTLSALGYPESFDEIFEQWVIANYLDNITYLNGKYGYFHYNFPPCRIEASYSQFPTGIKTGSASSYAVDYMLFSSTIPRDISIQFDGADTLEFRLTFIKLGNTNSQIYSVESFPLDTLNSASYYFDSLGMDVKKIIMVVMCTDPSLGEGEKAFYTYCAESILDVDTEPNSVISFELYQNYPNPFNPTTKIRYSIPQRSYVVIKVFDILGNEIETIVDKEKPAGSYESTWNAVNLPSGVYLYSMRSNEFRETRKMILLR